MIPLIRLFFLFCFKSHTSDARLFLSLSPVELSINSVFLTLWNVSQDHLPQIFLLHHILARKLWTLLVFITAAM